MLFYLPEMCIDTLHERTVTTKNIAIQRLSLEIEDLLIMMYTNLHAILVTLALLWHIYLLTMIRE